MQGRFGALLRERLETAAWGRDAVVAFAFCLGPDQPLEEGLARLAASASLIPVQATPYLGVEPRQGHAANIRRSFG